VLIVGAGSGTDVATALAQGAKHVDAVEIDPRLYEIGKHSHPNHPYQDPRVSVHINDGRAYLEHSNKRWDLILFALPDSLTLVSGQSSLRLESYLFTEEALETARDHLTPGGTFSMYNFYRQTWLVDRLAGTLDDVFGRSPCLDKTQHRLTVMVDSLRASSLSCDAVWRRKADTPSPAHDDYPFVYLRTRTIPGFYLEAIIAILVASLLMVRLGSGPLRQMTPYVDLFFMGAAFLLLETKNVVQFSLLFGTTWFVNALVFAGILVSVFFAVEVARKVRLPDPRVLYGLLLAALVVAWAIPPDKILGLATIPRFLAAVAIAFAPVFLANLVFAQRFRDVGSSTVAFGANLLGAMVGGLLEYMSLIVGYRTLLGAVAILYGLAFLFGRQHLTVPERVAAVAD
jgi:SAM-dependent methyltransferase